VLFDSLSYALFLAAVVLTAARLRSRPGWALPAFLLAASACFYAVAGWLPLLLFAASIVFNQFLMERIHRDADPASRRNLMALGILYNLCYLFAFKYAAFLQQAWGSLGAWLGWWSPPASLVEVLLPIGISFYTFESLSILTDVYRGRYEPPSLPDHALFVGFFPHLIAGPILRGKDLLPQIVSLRRSPPKPDWGRGASFLALGLFKKVVLANNLALYANAVFGQPKAYGAAQAWLGTYAFAFQIFFDFSGYSDMAEGSAALLGLRLAQNFKDPYRAGSLSEFWRRWHVSLSSWLRDYLYIPLGGSRHGVLRTYTALFVTMLLGGLWHGANWTFVLWGAYHGLLLGAERALGASEGAAAPWWRRLLTFHLVLLGWACFRAKDFGALADWCRQAFGSLGGPGKPELCLILGLAAAWAFQRRSAAWERRAWEQPGGARLSPALIGVLAGLSLALKLVQSNSAQPFIYFRF
jgi:D-alanyl-lipoteichoic acid acyltransferase DltB (MBOAT superfamily)